MITSPKPVFVQSYGFADDDGYGFTGGYVGRQP